MKVSPLAALGLTWLCLPVFGATDFPDGSPRPADQAGLDPEEIAMAQRLRNRAAAGDHQAHEILADLTSEIGPRPAGSEAERRAAQWALARLSAFGFQNVHNEPFTVMAWRRVSETAEITSPYPQKLLVTALGNSVSTPPEGIETEIALFQSYREMLNSPSGSFAGKIVVVTQPMPVGGYTHDYEIRSNGPSEAARRGALAYLMRSLGTDGRRVTHTGSTSYGDQRKIPAGALSAVDAEQLERIWAHGLPVRIHLTLRTEMTAGQVSETVVGEIPGREHPDEIVLIGAHLDSWDLGTGALDDGAGVAVTMAAARLIAELPRRPKRTIRVVLFGAEEIGESKKAYVQRHSLAEQSHTVMASECDQGAGRIYAIQLPRGQQQGPLADDLNALVESLGAFVSPEPATQAGPDLEELRGVPFANLQQDITRYFDFHHSAEDTLDKVDRRDLDQMVAVWAIFTYIAAETSVQFRVADAPMTP